MIHTFQAGVKQIVLAVSYRAEMLEKEMKEQEERVSERHERCAGVPAPP